MLKRLELAVELLESTISVLFQAELRLIIKEAF
jgi:hypothetical protein